MEIKKTQTKRLHAVGSSEDPAGCEEDPTTHVMEIKEWPSGSGLHGNLPGVGAGERLAAPENPISTSRPGYPTLGELARAWHRCGYWRRSSG